MYVIEKYCFTLILGIASLTIAIAVSAVIGSVNDEFNLNELLIAGGSVFALVLVINSVMIPLQIKYGAGKGKTATFAVGGIAVVSGYIAVQIFQRAGIDFDSILNAVSQMSIYAVVGIIAALIIVIMLISVKISIAVLNKKEF